MARIKTAQLTMRGKLRFDVATGTGRSFTFDDTPSDGLGPLETVLAALAGCTAMDVASIVRKKRQRITRYEVHARAVQRDEYPRYFTRIDLVHEMEGPAVAEGAVRRAIELSATTYCPVSAMLAAGPTEIHHAFRMVGADGVLIEDEVVVTGPFARLESSDPGQE